MIGGVCVAMCVYMCVGGGCVYMYVCVGICVRVCVVIVNHTFPYNRGSTVVHVDE